MKDSEEEEDFLGSLTAVFKEENLGSAVDPNLAKFTLGIVTKRVSETVAKGLIKELPRPENVPALAKPSVNTEIWSDLKENTRLRH